jgi:hypothetical protein
MKIDKILFVSDSNINYLSFWNSISRYYKKRFNLNSKLFFIGEKTSQNEYFLSEEYGEVEVIKPLENVPIIIQALWGKFWFTQTELETTWLIGDIDLYLLNKKYFQDCMSKIPDGKYAHINANGYNCGNWWLKLNPGLPGYFHCASGKKFKEYLELSDSFEQDCTYIFNSKKYGILYNGSIPNEEYAPQRVKDKKEYGYICCEENLTTERLIKYKDEMVSITYPSNSIRIETSYAQKGLVTPDNYELYNSFNPNLKDMYIDLHAPRPYTTFGKDTEKIIDLYL